MGHEEPNRWQGFVLGIVGGAVATVAMGGYWKVAQSLTGDDPRARTNEGEPRPLDDISLVGTHHGAEESSTAAMGRIAYERLAGTPPASDETTSTLSYVVHYGYGSLQGGVYGAARAGAAAPDVPGGLAYGTGMCCSATSWASRCSVSPTGRRSIRRRSTSTAGRRTSSMG